MADFSGSDPIIYREPLQTEQYDSLSLNGMWEMVSYLLRATNVDARKLEYLILKISFLPI